MKKRLISLCTGIAMLMSAFPAFAKPINDATDDAEQNIEMVGTIETDETDNQGQDTLLIDNEVSGEAESVQDSEVYEPEGLVTFETNDEESEAYDAYEAGDSENDISADLMDGAIYHISTAEELNAVRNDLTGTYYLDNDIDLSVYDNWIPIGNTDAGFSGVFNGQGHKITGMTINSNEYSYTGFFAKVTGTVINLGVEGNITTENDNVGVLAGYVRNGKITNCFTAGAITAKENVGGLIGYTYSSNNTPTTVENCYSRVTITGLKTGESNNLGGLIGSDYVDYNSKPTIIKRCYSAGYINPKNDNAYCSGLIAYLNKYANSYTTYATILFCYYDKNIAKTTDTNRGFAATTAQMKTQSIFTGWDFENVWGIDANINDGYPYLKFGTYKYTNEGSGTELAPYLIYNQNDLIAITEGKISGNFKLMNDITLDAVFWTPIGGNRSGRSFDGVFNGDGHTIYGLNITQNNFDYSGLFGYVTGTIKNLGVSGNIDISNDNTGMLAGYVHNGTITNCFTVGTITAKENVGGLIGYTYSSNNTPTTVENCYSRVTITGLKTGESNNLGGLIGSDYVDYNSNPTVIKRCYSAGYINPKNDDAYCGGFIAHLNKYSNSYTTYATILFCYYDRNVSKRLDTNMVFSATTAQMKTQSIFTGWDFENVWGIDANINDGYPYLKFGTYEYENEGSGSKYDPYMIYTTEDLIAITEGSIGKTGSYYELANDITLDAVFWTPIGGNRSHRNFDGIFNGAGHTIYGVNITQSNFTFSGLFGYVTGTITNLSVAGKISVSKDYVGMLAGYVNNGTISNCFTVGTIKAKEYVGGLIGYTYSSNNTPTTVENCYSRVTITGLKTGESNNLGGLIGRDYVDYNSNPTIIKRCYFAGVISDENAMGSDIGGLVGSLYKYGNSYTNYATILFCYYDKDIAKTTDTNRGFAATTAQMKTQSIFTGWDFENVWGIDANVNDGYPYLKFGTYEYENEGSGSKYDPYMIYTTEDLIAITEGSIGKTGSYYELANDITLDAVFWTPIGGNRSGRSFDGVFNGAGHTIYGLNITQNNFDYSGLFGYVTGTITNLGVSGNIDVSTDNVGMLAGYVHNGTITNCFTVGAITAKENVGGLIGHTYSSNNTPTTVENCYSRVTVTGLKTGESNYLGGFIGKDYVDYNSNPTIIKQCYSTGYINPKNDNAVYGGLIGSLDKYGNSYTQYAQITSCFYDKETSVASDTGKGIPLSTAEMKDTAAYTAWDFTDTWAINTSVNDGYPYLQVFNMEAVVPVTKLELDKTAITLTVGESEKLNSVITPNNATNKVVYWTSSNNNYAVVSNGVVTGISKGSAIITVSTADGKFTANCAVNVIEPSNIAATGVTLNKSSLSLIEGRSETLTASVSPSNATNKTVTWESSDASIANVTNGTVTAKKAGTAVITAATADGGYTASCTVTVTAKTPAAVSVTGVTLNKSAISLEEGKSDTLTASVSPSNATNKTVTWKSSDAGIASVTNGIVTAKKAGTAVITATTADGGYTANCTVTVTKKVVNENAPKIKINDIKAKSGNTVDITVSLENNTGFANMGIEIGYDSDVMTLTKVTPNSGVGGTFTPAQMYTVKPYNMSWDSASNIMYNGDLVTLTFKISDNVADGSYPVTVDYYKGINGNYVDGNNVNYDENFDAVGFVYVSGNVIISSYIPGDINGDEVVDNKDATYLLRYLAGWSLSGVVEDALDIDGSESVDNKDATILLRYLAGWNVTLH